MPERCPACQDPSSGLPHTCAGSGTFRAAEAHVAGAVDAIEEAWPRYQVVTTFRLRAPDEYMARDRLTDFVSTLLEDDQVESAEFSISPYDIPAAA